jgi:hypothetical protein
MSGLEKKSIYIYLTLAVLVIIIIGLFKDSIFSFGRSGAVYISHLDEGSIVFIDNQEKKRIDKPEDNLILRGIESGAHTILISRDGYWPWFKEIQIKKGESVKLSPFFVSDTPNSSVISTDDENYNLALSKINSVSLPTFNKKKISKDGSIAFWVDKETLFVEWLLDERERPDYFCNEFGCHNVYVPLGVETDIKNVDFYKNRNDVFVISFGNGVFALEANNKDNQNFQPIFEGNNPQFVLNDENSIYVLDSNILRKVSI